MAGAVTLFIPSGTSEQNCLQIRKKGGEYKPVIYCLLEAGGACVFALISWIRSHFELVVIRTIALHRKVLKNKQHCLAHNSSITATYKMLKGKQYV